jgi:sortase (surface protein transpeptidase)
MLGSRRAALLVLAAGLIAVGAGAAGLALTRHPVAAQWGAVPTLPAPTGPIAAASQQQPAVVSRPVALTIPSIGVQTSLVNLGLTAAGALQVPSSTAVAGWYTGSPRPGAVGSAVIAGHIDSRAGPGVFFRLSALRPGDRVYVRRADGTLAVFRVTLVRQYAKDSFPTSAVYGPTPDAELRLITCGGTFDPQLRSYLSNTVAYAVETG